ncbi:MAG: hypothetical protein AAGK05_16655 [Pseudomonadota bacterium]
MAIKTHGDEKPKDDKEPKEDDEEPKQDDEEPKEDDEEPKGDDEERMGGLEYITYLKVLMDHADNDWEKCSSRTRSSRSSARTL